MENINGKYPIGYSMTGEEKDAINNDHNLNDQEKKIKLNEFQKKLDDATALAQWKKTEDQFNEPQSVTDKNFEAAALAMKNLLAEELKTSASIKTVLDSPKNSKETRDLLKNLIKESLSRLEVLNAINPELLSDNEKTQRNALQEEYEKMLNDLNSFPEAEEDVPKKMINAK